MNRYVWVAVFITGLLLLAGNAGAKEINLAPGEIYRQGGLTVTCGESATDAPLVLKECQYWDDFHKKCLFEKTIYMYKKLECVEECQHWDAFSKICHYQTKCVFYPDQKAFVRITCEEFDDFSNVCVKKKESRIGRTAKR